MNYLFGKPIAQKENNRQKLGFINMIYANNHRSLLLRFAYTRSAHTALTNQLNVLFAPYFFFNSIKEKCYCTQCAGKLSLAHLLWQSIERIHLMQLFLEFKSIVSHKCLAIEADILISNPIDRIGMASIHHSGGKRFKVPSYILLIFQQSKGVAEVRLNSQHLPTGYTYQVPLHFMAYIFLVNFSSYVNLINHILSLCEKMQLIEVGSHHYIITPSMNT